MLFMRAAVLIKIENFCGRDNHQVSMSRSKMDTSEELSLFPWLSMHTISYS